MSYKFLITLLMVGGFFGLRAQEIVIRKPNMDIYLDSSVYNMQKLYREQMEGEGIPGYRIQVFNGSRRESLRMRSQFIDAFPGIPVYSIYEQPEFKVQVGDYRTRIEAERALMRIQKVFSGSLVLKTTINFPE